MASDTSKVDSILAKDQLQALQAMLKAWGEEVFMSSLFWVLPKEHLELASGRIATLVPFRLTRLQKHMHSRKGRNNLLVKPRQIGGTTYFLLDRLLLPAVTDHGIGSYLISHNNEYAEKHFQIVRRAYRNIGAVDPYDDKLNDLCISLKAHLLHTEKSTRRELIFDWLDSRVMIGSAEVEESGQGVTLHHIVASEYSRWPGKPESTLSNVRGALVKWGTVDKECTANGAAGPFYEDVLRALNNPKESDAVLHYYSWWWEDGYDLKLSDKEAKELESDLQADEKRVLKKIHHELQDITWHQGMEKIAWRRVSKLEHRGEFDEKYPEDVLTAFLVTGKQYFDRELLVARKFELVGFTPYQTFSNGEAKIYHPRQPGHRYVIGVDVATGREVSTTETDFCAAAVIDLDTGEEYGSYRAKVTPQDLAYDLADMGHYFNDAIIAVERTGDGGTTILTLTGECKYPAVMKFKEWFKRNRQRTIVEIEGFPTTTKTRPIALNFLNRHIIDHPEHIWDEDFVNEALVFVRDEKGKPQAAKGAHDDRVSARWIAHAARMHLLGYWLPTDERRESYESADRLVGGTTPNS